MYCYAIYYVFISEISINKVRLSGNIFGNKSSINTSLICTYTLLKYFIKVFPSPYICNTIIKTPENKRRQ